MSQHFRGLIIPRALPHVPAVPMHHGSARLQYARQLRNMVAQATCASNLRRQPAQPTSATNWRSILRTLLQRWLKPWFRHLHRQHHSAVLPRAPTWLVRKRVAPPTCATTLRYRPAQTASATNLCNQLPQQSWAVKKVHLQDQRPGLPSWAWSRPRRSDSAPPQCATSMRNLDAQPGCATTLRNQKAQPTCTTNLRNKLLQPSWATQMDGNRRSCSSPRRPRERQRPHTNPARGTAPPPSPSRLLQQTKGVTPHFATNAKVQAQQHLGRAHHPHQGKAAEHSPPNNKGVSAPSRQLPRRRSHRYQLPCLRFTSKPTKHPDLLKPTS